MGVKFSPKSCDVINERPFPETNENKPDCGRAKVEAHNALNIKKLNVIIILK
jgi:hypothetical protein